MVAADKRQDLRKTRIPPPSKEGSLHQSNISVQQSSLGGLIIFSNSKLQLTAWSIMYFSRSSRASGGFPSKKYFTVDDDN